MHPKGHLLKRRGFSHTSATLPRPSDAIWQERHLSIASCTIAKNRLHHQRPPTCTWLRQELQSGRRFLACSAGIFRVFSELSILARDWVDSPPPPPTYPYCPGRLYVFLQASSDVWIQDGARLISRRSLAKIRLHCRLERFCACVVFLTRKSREKGKTGGLGFW